MESFPEMTNSVGRACTPATSCSGGGPATPAHWLGWPFRADVSGATRS